MWQALRSLPAPIAALRILRGGRKLARDEHGATLVEFGLLAVPFFAIIFAILETAMVFLASNILDGAVDYGTRLIRTGQSQSYTIGSFRTAICERTFGLFDCTLLKIKVNKFSNFGSVTTTPPLSAIDGTWTMTEQYDPGIGGDIIQVEVYYKWPSFLNLFSMDLANTADNARLFASVRAFKNEPF